MSVAHDPPLRRNRALAIVIASLFFLAVAPTLPWQEFSNAPENLVVATAQEMRRGGPWLVPTLQGEPRIAKPPLAAWITASAIVPWTMRDIDTLDQHFRTRGYFLLALETRLPALMSACLMLIGVFALGRAVRDSTTGVIVAAVCASSLFMLKSARFTTTDMQLALWVTWANVYLVHALVQDRWWCLIGAGVTLGLAMLSKGPVALVQSLVPVLMYHLIGLRGAARRFSSSVDSQPQVRTPIGPVIAGIVAFVIVGLWWYVVVLLRTPNVLQRWFSEVFRVGATESPPGNPLMYLAIVGLVAPWTVFFVVGFAAIIRQLRSRQITRDLLPLLLVVVPLLIMTLAKDRQERYALPMLPAAAVVVAIGICEYFRSFDAPSRIDKLVAALHWLTLFSIAVIFPLVGATPLLKRATGEPWFAWQFAAIEAALGAVLLLAGILRHRRRRSSIVTTTVILMFIAQAVFSKGFATSVQGRSEMKWFADVLAARYPDATVYNAHPTGKRPPTDLGVYLNRTIEHTDDPASIVARGHPAILLMRQNADDPMPTPPPGWRPAEKAARGRDWWWAFVLPPS